MMMAWLAGVTTAVLVAVVLWAERVKRPAVGIPAKVAASAVFVAVGLLRHTDGAPWDSWVVCGLLLGAAGDLLLALPRGFVPGLIVFLLGHAAYGMAFATLAPPMGWGVATLGPVACVSAVALGFLWPHLGRLRWAVVAYVVVISAMVWGAAGTVGAGGPGWQRLAGASLFYVSDLFVARNRFVERRFINRAVGLPLYYAGQLLLAFTVGAS